MSIPAAVIPRRLGLRAVSPLVASLVAAIAPPVRPEPPPGSSPDSSLAARPDIVVLLADDLGYADLGIQGSADLRTPHLDRIARGGLQFTDGYVSAPQCTPSRAGLVTGRYPQRFRYAQNDTRRGLPADEVTLAEALRDAGYATAAIGKWHLGLRLESNPLEHGFDEFFGIPGGVSRYLPDPNLGFIPGVYRDRAPWRESEELTSALGREAAAFVTRSAGRPLFLYLAFNAPHYPLEATPAALARTRLPEGPRRTYAAMVATMDDAVGTVLDALRQSGREDNTLVFFLSDNGGAVHLGGASNAPFRGSKKTLNEGGIRVPFLARWPRGLAGGRIEPHPVIQLDIFPTALAACGIPAAPGVDGVDLALALFDGRTGSAPEDTSADAGRSLAGAVRSLDDRPLYWRFAFGFDEDDRQWAIRRGRYKLMRAARSAPMLVDLAADPEEGADLSAEDPEVTAALREAWEIWNADLPDTWSDGPADDFGDLDRGEGNLSPGSTAPADSVADSPRTDPPGE